MDSPNITQKEAFLKYLQRMDIGMLELILDDSIIYFGVPKKVFLEKLSYIFKQVILGGGKAPLRIKLHKKKTNVYYILLQVYSYAIKFIIEEKEGNIIEIYDNKIITCKEDIESLSQFALFFGNDEKIDFTPSNDYVMNLYRCTNAYEELVNDKIQMLTSEDISYWVNKHTLLYEEVKEAYLLFKFNNFRHLFFSFEYLLEEIQNYNEVKTALKSFDDSNETSFRQWLVEYYSLAYCKVLSFDINFSDIDEGRKAIKCRSFSNIYFKGDDFFAIIKFNELYRKHLDIYESAYLES